ncbi:hypothetical protein [Thermococcus sp. PK]|uniref:hypothetical protein n=1 Tax=Thermococcus sp. PK TaxID=913025 RepID=UPI0005B2BF9F|nr:hypothetical protein [Thermococcus sp. PK]
MKITTSENELIELLPGGSGNFYADGAYDSKGSKKRDRVFSEEEYRHRNPHEGFWGAFTTWFGSRIPCFLKKTTVTRILLGVMCYGLKILLRVKYCLNNRG